jgi:hypothetical protein
MSTVLGNEFNESVNIVSSAVSSASSAVMTAINGNDALSVMIFGMLYLLFGYGIVFGYYISSLKKINDGQANLYGVVLKAFMLQVASLLFIWVLLLSLNFLSKYSSSVNMSYATATLMFFKVNWLNVDIVAMIESFSANGQPIESAGLLLMIQGVWIVLTVGFVIVPVFLVIGAMFIVYKTTSQQSANVSQTSLISGIISTLVLTMVVFTIHFLLPAVFLKGMDRDFNSELTKFSKGTPTFDGYDYNSRAKAFIQDSIK